MSIISVLRNITTNQSDFMQFEVGVNNVSRKRYISSRSNFTLITNLIGIAYPKIEQFYPIEKIFS